MSIRSNNDSYLRVSRSFVLCQEIRFWDTKFFDVVVGICGQRYWWFWSNKGSFALDTGTVQPQQHHPKVPYPKVQQQQRGMTNTLETWWKRFLNRFWKLYVGSALAEHRSGSVLLSCRVVVKFADIMSGLIIINPANVYSAIKKTWEKYVKTTPSDLKLIDAYIVYIVMTAVAQILYAMVIGTTYPFNSLLSGVISCIGSFTLAVSLRMQINDRRHNPEFKFSPERAFADFILGNVLLHFIVISYLG